MAPDEQIAALVTRYGVSRGLARDVVYRGLQQRCAELAARDSDPRRGFIAAANALCARSAPFLPLADIITRTGAA